MLYMNTHEVSKGIKEITLTYKEHTFDKQLLTDMIDYVLDEYNIQQQEQEMSLGTDSLPKN